MKNLFNALRGERKRRDCGVRGLGDHMLADIGLLRGDLARLSGLVARPGPISHE